MRLTVIGCSGSFPTPDSPASCYLVEHDGARLVLDLGNGALGPLQRFADLRSLDGLYLSHLHADHCLDVTSLFVALKYHPDGPPPGRLPVIGPAATRERIAAAYRSCADESGPDLEAAFDFTPITLGPSQLGPFKVTSVRVNHPVPAYALRVEAGGRSLVYSGDTGPCEALEDLAGGADLALFEASNLTGPAQAPNLHMTAAQAANHARAAKVGSLVLTHLVTWNDRRETFAEARDIFKGELALATPGMVVDL